ncbi:hypothetical protein WKT22_00156 [Candidatus Lokiarchaeum ossiferum]
MPNVIIDFDNYKLIDSVLYQFYAVLLHHGFVDHVQVSEDQHILQVVPNPSIESQDQKPTRPLFVS